MFKRVFGRLDPSTHGKSFTQMQTILHAVQRERNVECKEISDGFVLCGNLDEMKAVNIALESKLNEERSLTRTSLEELDHAANVLTESKAVHKSLSMDGGVKSSGSEHDCLKTESSLLTFSSVDGRVEAQKISEKGNDGSSAVNTPFLESCHFYDSVSKTVEPIQSTTPTQQNNQLAFDEGRKIIEGSDCKDKTDFIGDISGSESQCSVLGDGSTDLSRVEKIKPLSEEEIPKQSMENTETRDSCDVKSVCKSPEKRKSNELSPQHRKPAPKKCKLTDSHDIQPGKEKFTDENMSVIQSSSSRTPASNKVIYQRSLVEENRQVKSNIKDSENRKKQKKNDVGVENFEEFVTATNLTVRLFVGKISGQRVDVILCPTNAEISCSEGLTKMILDEGGQIKEEEFLRKTRVKDEFKESCTLIPSCGELPSKAILHAVLPLWEPEKQVEKDVKRRIHRCLKDGLTLCSGRRMESIAMPPLGQHTNNIPLEVSAEIITRVVATFSRTIGPLHNGIKEVRIVCENDKSLEAFVTSFLSFSFPGETPFFAHQQKEAKSSMILGNNAEVSNFVSSQQSPEETSENKAANFKQATSKATEELPDVDSVALNKAEGNGEIQADLSRQPAQNKEVRKCVSDNQHNAAVNSQSVIQSSSSRTPASNKVIYQRSLVEENRQVKSNIKDSENRKKQKKNDVGVENFEEFVTATNLTVRLFVGKISGQRVDVILCPTNAEISCSEGLTKMILDEGGQIKEEEFLRKTRVKDEFKESCTLIPSCGELPSKAILHAVLPLWEPEKQVEKDVKRRIHRCLKDGLTLCSGRRMESIAMPPLGQHTNNIPLEVSAEIITRVVATFSRTIGPLHNGIKEVRIVCENDKSLEAFVTSFLSFSFPGETPFFAHQQKEAKSSMILGNNAEVSNFVSSQQSPEETSENKAANFKQATSKATEELLDVDSVALNKAEGNGEIQADLSRQPAQNKEVRKCVIDNQHNAAVNSQREECEEMISSLANNPVQSTEVATMKVVKIQEEKKTAHPDSTERKVVDEKILGSEYLKGVITSHIDQEEKVTANAQSNGRVATEISKQPKHSIQPPKIKESLFPKGAGAKFRSRGHGNPDILTNGTYDSSTPSKQWKLAASINRPAKPITSPTVENLLSADLCLGFQGLKLSLEERLDGGSHENGGPSREERILGEMEQPLSSFLAEGNHGMY